MMPYLRLCCALVLTALWCAPAAAVDQPTKRITLEQALELLETENPDTLAARLQIAEAEAERVAARLYPNPTLSVDANNIPAGRTTPSGLSVGQTIGSTARLDQPLVLWGKRGLRRQGAELGIAAATQSARDALRELRAAVKDAFYQALRDQQLLQFAGDNQQRYQRIVELNQRRFHSGDISEVEYRKIELENLKFLTETEEARRALSESQQLLGRLTGASGGLAANGALAAPDVDIAGEDLLETARANRPDLAAAQQARAQAATALTLAKRERYPDVTVGADYTHSEFVVAGDNRNTIGFGFSLPLPLLNQNQGEIAKAEVALREADTGLARLRLDIAQDVHDARVRYESTQRLRHTFESGYLDHAKTVVTSAETSYRVGAASLLELLDAERTYTETRTDYVNTIFAARSSLTALEKAIAKDLAPGR